MTSSTANDYEHSTDCTSGLSELERKNREYEAVRQQRLKYIRYVQDNIDRLGDDAIREMAMIVQTANASRR